MEPFTDIFSARLSLLSNANERIQKHKEFLTIETKVCYKFDANL